MNRVLRRRFCGDFVRGESFPAYRARLLHKLSVASSDSRIATNSSRLEDTAEAYDLLQKGACIPAQRKEEYPETLRC
jgi:hypothetical protein